MDYKVVMPRLSDSMDEGQLVEWKIHPGERVKSGDVIAEVESDKAVMEIQTFKSGIVKEIMVEAGKTVPVGTTMAIIDTEGTATSAHEKERTEQQNSSTGKIPETEQAPPQNTEGEKVPKRHGRPKTGTEEAPKAEKSETATSIPPSSASALDFILGTDKSTRTQGHSYTRGNASPRARSLASQYGIDIETLQKEHKLPLPAHAEDIKRYRLQSHFTPGALELLAQYQLSDTLFDTEKRHDKSEIMAYIQAHDIPLPRPFNILQKAMISMLEEAAKRPIYHIYDHIDATLLKKHETKERTVTVWILKLFAEAIMRHEVFRMTLASDGIRLWPNASISLAMANGENLYMPVLKDLNRKSIAQIVKTLDSYKKKVRERKLSREELTGSTFGISNLGMTGIESFDAMINKEDCAIAAIGSERDGKIAVTLTIDHRIVNGYQAAEFMQTLKALASDPHFFTR